MADHTVKPGDKIKKVLKNAAPGDTMVFQQGKYENLELDVNVKELTLRSDKAEVTGKSVFKLNRPGVTVEGFTFIGNGVIDVRINNVDDESTMGKNAVIRNNVFKNHEGYAKRILVGSSSRHEAINMNALIENNKIRPRSSDRPLYAFITSAIGERPQYNLLKINILNFSGILPYALISH